MMDYATYKLLHRHGNDWEEVAPRQADSPAELDPERDWVAEGKVFECSCGDSFVIVPGREPEPTATARAQ